MKIAIVSANLGGYDPQVGWVPQIVPSGVSVDTFRFTDANFPPRPLAMTSRLQAAIPKWWGWQMRPGYDVYIWIDASCAPTSIAVEWFLDRLADGHIAVFQHPERRSIREEYEFMELRMARPGERYLNSRYRGEWLREQYEYIASNLTYYDEHLYASTAFAYKPALCVRDAFRDIWGAKARWLLHDQLMFPFALHKHHCHVKVIADNYLQCDALTFTRRGERRMA